MPQVRTPSGDVITTTSAGALAYYRREPGYEILGAEAAKVAVADEQPGSSPVKPAGSAHKQDWVDYALAVAPDNAEAINKMTADELKATYGGE